MHEELVCYVNGSNWSMTEKMSLCNTLIYKTFNWEVKTKWYITVTIGLCLQDHSLKVELVIIQENTVIYDHLFYLIVSAIITLRVAFCSTMLQFFE